jgi:tRNA(Leu) C34 or U34 (ribose-2'-O)-methylase TrmL
MSVFWYPSLLASSIAGRSASLNVSNTDAIALYEIIQNQPSADSEA